MPEFDLTSDPAARLERNEAFAPHPLQDPNDDLIGQIVGGRYRILSLAGRGGMGAVYKCEQIFLRKRFALKTFANSIDSDVARVRFQKEAQAASRLDHPNIAKALDFGSIDDDRLFLVMEFVEGLSLGHYLKQYGRYSIEEALPLFIQISFALAYAHSRGIVHRDIKPTNIILVAGAGEGGEFLPKIVDFGIAKLLEESEAESMTKTGEIFGTPLYMSPEQCSGTPIDIRSDIYSLGCVFYEALTGVTPFRARTAMETMVMHRCVMPPSLTEASMGIQFPEGVEKVVATMLAKDPNHRYGNCTALGEDLMALKSGKPVQARATEMVADEAAKQSRQNKSSLVVLICFAVVIGGFALIPFVAKYIDTDADSASDSKATESSADSNSSQEKQVSADYDFPSSFDKPTPRSFCSIVSKKGGKVRRFDFGSESLGTVVNLDSKSHFPAVRVIDFPADAGISFRPNTQFVADHSSWLARFNADDLCELNFADDLKSGEEIKQFEPYFDNAMGCIDRLTGLRKLNLNRAPVSLRGFQKIDFKKLSLLKELKLGNTLIDVAQLPNSEVFERIELLDVSRDLHASAILPLIEHSNKLKELVAEEAGLTDEDLARLSKIETLSQLRLDSNEKITDAGFEHLVSLPNLRKIEFLNARLTPACAKSLLKIPKLQSIEMSANWSKEEQDEVTEMVGAKKFHWNSVPKPLIPITGTDWGPAQ